MLFWIVAASLTLGACLAVMAPLARRAPATAADEAHDLEVYRDQLAELEREVAEGLIDPVEAGQARAEIGRRVLKASAAVERQSGGRSRSLVARAVGALAILSIPLVSWGLYATIGSPGLPAQPLQARLERDPAASSVIELVARAEAHLAANPGDARGWDVIAPVYVRMGRAGEAVNAYRKAIGIDGETAQRQTGLGEALVAVAGGLVTAEAQEAFERALEIEPGSPRARFFLATGLAQEGRDDEALAIFQAMAAELPQDSPWHAVAVEALQDAGVAIAAAAPGPDARDMAAAADMSDADRDAMIEGMVASLDARLRAEPGDAEGWQRLVRSYVVLGREDAARDALDRALAALGRDSEAGVQLLALADGLGIEAGETGR